MKWFGEPWDAPICDPAERVDTPIDRKCQRCEALISPIDRGFMCNVATVFGDSGATVPIHLLCFMRAVTPEPEARGALHRVFVQRAYHMVHAGHALCGFGEADRDGFGEPEMKPDEWPATDRPVRLTEFEKINCPLCIERLAQI